MGFKGRARKWPSAFKNVLQIRNCSISSEVRLVYYSADDCIEWIDGRRIRGSDTGDLSHLIYEMAKYFRIFIVPEDSAAQSLRRDPMTEMRKAPNARKMQLFWTMSSIINDVENRRPRPSTLYRKDDSSDDSLHSPIRDFSSSDSSVPTSSKADAAFTTIKELHVPTVDVAKNAGDQAQRKCALWQTVLLAWSFVSPIKASSYPIVGSLVCRINWWFAKHMPIVDVAKNAGDQAQRKCALWQTVLLAWSFVIPIKASSYPIVGSLVCRIIWLKILAVILQPDEPISLAVILALNLPIGNVIVAMAAI
uniref:PINc domain-containing protein n=1 Tax=Ascaris lumbricoides TaxID=6252 RepID=A0A0M3HUD3_ASCLU